jgi:hypothetical protein
MIDIRIPRKELNRDFLYKLDAVCGEFDLQACVTIIETIPVPIEHITLKGALVVGEEKNE